MIAHKDPQKFLPWHTVSQRVAARHETRQMFMTAAMACFFFEHLFKLWYQQDRYCCPEKHHIQLTLNAFRRKKVTDHV